MTQANQHTSARAVAAKAKTTEALKGDILADAKQTPVRASSVVRATFSENLFKAQNRKMELEGTITALSLELEDVEKVIRASEAGIMVIDEVDKPVINIREPVQIGSAS